MDNPDLKFGKYWSFATLQGKKAITRVANVAWQKVLLTCEAACVAVVISQTVVSSRHKVWAPIRPITIFAI